MKGNQSLLYRPLESSDLDWLMELENNTEHWFTGERQVPYSRFILEQYLQNAKETLGESGQYRWVIERKEDARSIGLLDLFNHSDRHHRASVGILIEKSFRNKGYGRAALGWLASYASDVANLHQLHAEITSDNEASIELFKNSGYSISGVLKDWIRRKEGYTDMVQMQIIL